LKRRKSFERNLALRKRSEFKRHEKEIQEKYGGKQSKLRGSQLQTKLYSYKSFRDFPVKEE